ncbi:MAG: dockerin type I repeat-containing protein [Ruminococcus sp.]|nr:dockerin type I repeat-containing protein [Ruminococcus sp.]
MDIKRILRTLSMGALSVGICAAAAAAGPVMKASAELLPLSASGSYVKGDVDGDGDVTYLDISKLISVINGEEKLSGTVGRSGTGLWAADVDGSGAVDYIDIDRTIAIINSEVLTSDRHSSEETDESGFTSTRSAPSYLVLKEDYEGLVHTREYDADRTSGVMYDNLYYGYQVDEDTYELYYRNSTVRVPKDKIRDGVFVSNPLNHILPIGMISQFDEELNDVSLTGKDPSLSCGPASIAMTVVYDLGKTDATVTDVFLDGNAKAEALGTYPNDLYGHNYNYHREDFRWCETGYTGTTHNGICRLLEIYADREGKTVADPGVGYCEPNNTTIDKIDKALSQGHLVIAAVRFNSRYSSTDPDKAANFLPSYSYTHYVVIAGECDGSNNYDGCYAIADPYKQKTVNSSGKVICDDTKSGLTVVKKQVLARSINSVSENMSWFRGIVYIQD